MAARFIFILILAWEGLTSIHPVSAKEVCYKVVGCFNNYPPFDNAQDELPSNPHQIGTKFHLYTKEKMSVPTTLSYTQPVSITNSKFRSDRPTKVIIHGFQNDQNTAWIKEMRRELLKQGDYNVIVVVWAKGSSVASYAKATANVRLVGVEIKILFQLLQRVSELQLSDVHFIGHSLGAHLAGYAGTLLGNRIGRITGLDPADPHFQDLPSLVRLDSTDAQFVDVIHTDGREFESSSMLGFGLSQRSGHIDFYINGGENQRGCQDGYQGLVGGMAKALWGKTELTVTESAGIGLSCSHGRAHSIFIESINSKCRFQSFPCLNYRKFLQGHCYDCGESGCSAAGFYAGEYPEARGEHFLITYAASPYCGAIYYQLFIEVQSRQSETIGEIFVQLRTKNGDFTRKIALMGRNTIKFGKTDINMPFVLDITLQQLLGVPLKELAQERLLVALTYKRKNSLFPEWLGGPSNNFHIGAITITEVATGQRFESRGKRQLSNNVQNVITLSPTTISGITG